MPTRSPTAKPFTPVPIARSDDLVSRYDRQARLRKVAIDDVQVCATHSAGGHLHEELARRDDGIDNSPALK
jgi:hypothetical protein